MSTDMVNCILSNEMVLPSGVSHSCVSDPCTWWCPLEWWCHQISADPAMHRQFCAHNECCYNTILIKNCQSPHHQFHTHWMFTKSPVSVVSPFQTQWLSTESPVSVISPVSRTPSLNVQWITSLCCLTSIKHTEYPLYHQPLVSHQSEAQWMFTESPVSHSFMHNKCQLGRCCYQNH